MTKKPGLIKRLAHSIILCSVLSSILSATSAAGLFGRLSCIDFSCTPRTYLRLHSRLYVSASPLLFVCLLTSSSVPFGVHLRSAGVLHSKIGGWGNGIALRRVSFVLIDFCCASPHSDAVYKYRCGSLRCTVGRLCVAVPNNWFLWLVRSLNIYLLCIPLVAWTLTFMFFPSLWWLVILISSSTSVVIFILIMKLYVGCCISWYEVFFVDG